MALTSERVLTDDDQVEVAAKRNNSFKQAAKPASWPWSGYDGGGGGQASAC